MIDTSKKFLVAGAGKSGIGSVNLLLKTGADVSLYDGKEDLEKEALYEKLYEKKEIPLILGNITKEDVSKFDLLVLSPGISVNAPIAQMFRDQEKPVGIQRKNRSDHRNQRKDNDNSADWRDHERIL